jgi:hypothetical protein
VPYGEPRRFSVVLRNTGGVEAAWCFLPQDSGIDDNAGGCCWVLLLGYARGATEWGREEGGGSTGVVPGVAE